MKHWIIFLCCLFFFMIDVEGQDYAKKFSDLLQVNDTTGQRALLKKWEIEKPNDPELFVAYFNYYVLKSKSEILEIGQNPNGKESLELIRTDSNSKEPSAYIYSNTVFDAIDLEKGFDWINRGISLYPNRLDMRFGKIYVLGQWENYQTFTDEIVKTIEYSDVNHNQWTWTNNKPLEDPQNKMLLSIQDYQVQLYNTENDSLLKFMVQIAETVLKYYPKHVESLSNISVAFMLQEKYNNALMHLLKAEEINPKDCIVLGNIAACYIRQGNKDQAELYYKKMIQYGDKENKNFAKAKMKALNKTP
jgi:tetratricopeptide (TPR) repeat protein